MPLGAPSRVVSSWENVAHRFPGDGRTKVVRSHSTSGAGAAARTSPNVQPSVVIAQPPVDGRTSKAKVKYEDEPQRHRDTEKTKRSNSSFSLLRVSVPLWFNPVLED